MNFTDFQLDPYVLDGIHSMGFEQATPIQAQAIPLILDGHDLVACAQTGTGKTGAYLIPVMHHIMCSDHGKVNTLIIAPTRELTQQIDQQIEGLSYYADINSMAIYGGGDGIKWEQQRKALTEGADIITATPGRLIALLTSGNIIDLSGIKHLVLDEADRMLDMGFHDDIMRIVSYLPKDRQTLLFSATMPARIRQMASRLLRNPKEVSIAISKPAEGITQQAYVVHETQKEELVKIILKQKDYDSVILFASTKENVKKLDQMLRRSGLASRAFHSDLEQNEREDLMRAFRNKEVRVLVGTDILSRGIDVEGINLVINYDSPSDPEDYVHRIGRTARADATGTAITLISPRDQPKFHRIEQLIEKIIPKMPLPEKLGPGPEYSPTTRPKEANRSFRGKPSFKRNKK